MKSNKARKETKTEAGNGLLTKWLLIIVLSTIAACFVSRFWFQAMLIQGSSMAPSYHHLQLVLVRKNVESYARGDVIAFQCDGLDSVLVKRIVAIPGDRVQIRDHKLFVNDELFDLYSEADFQFAGSLGQQIVLDRDQYIVIGDNVNASIDSRFDNVGIVAEEDIIGRLN